MKIHPSSFILPPSNSSFQLVKFGEIAKEVKSTTKDPAVDGLEFYVGLDHLDPQSLRIARKGIIAEDKPSFTRRFSAGQILFGKRRCYQRKAAVADFEGICSGDIIVMDAIPKKILPGLLPFIIQSDSFFDWAEKTSSGSLSPRTKWKSLAEFEFPLPPIERQKEILEVLEKVEECTRKCEDSLTLSISLLNVLLEHFAWREDKASGVGEKRRTIPLGEVANIQPGYAFKSTESVSKGVKWLKIANVGTDAIDWSVKSYLPDTFEEDHKSYLLKEGDLVIAMTRPVLSGKVKIAKLTKSDIPALLNQRVARVTPKNDFFTADELMLLIRSKRISLEIETQIFGTDPPNISGKELEHLPIPYLDGQNRKKIMNTVIKLAGTITTLKEKKVNSQTLTTSFLNSCLRGVQ